MTDEKYDVIFSGKILPGQDPKAVRERIGKLFRAGDAQLEALFSGTPVSIKKQIDLNAATRYRTAIQEAGALVDLRKSVPAARPAQTAPRPAREPDPTHAAPDPATGAEATMTLAPANTGTLEDCAPPVVPVPIPDIDDIHLAPVGDDLSSDTPPPPLEIDTHELSLAPPGTGPLETGDEASAGAPASHLEIDTHGLTLAPPKTGSLEDCHEDPYPIPIPDTSHLDIAPPEDSKDGNG